MDEHDLWDLAEQSALLISNIAACLIKEICGANTKLRTSADKAVLSTLGQLMARLYLIHNTLEKPNPDDRTTLRRRLGRVLKIFEELCTWHMKQAEISKHYGHLPTPYGTLLSLTTSSKSTLSPREIQQQIKRGISTFASGNSELIARYLKKLDGFSKSKRSGMQNCSTVQKANHFTAPDDIPLGIRQRFYRILKKYTACTCSPSRIRHWGRLRLKGRSQELENDVLFDTVFSETPPTVPSEDINWQQLQFRMSRNVSSGKFVKFAGDDSARPNPERSSTAEVSREVEYENFCKLLGTRHGRVRMRFRILDERLLELRGPEIPDQNIMPTSSVTLMRVLELHKLRSTGKIMLAYTLARSVWQFYDSDWMKIPWSTESIHFMREGSPPTTSDTELSQINPSDPYFAFEFDKSTHSIPFEYFDSWYGLHHYPRILALGVLLVEVCRGGPRKQYYMEAQTPEEKINNDCTKSWEMIKNKSWPDLDFRHGDIREVYRGATEVCLNTDVFKHTEDIAERRDILLNRVVCPLGKLLEDVGLIDESGNLKRIDEDWLSLKSSLHSVPRPSLLANGSTFEPSEIWLGSLIASKLTQDLHLFSKSKPLLKIKIAILDTGYDPEAPFFADNLRKSRIKGWRDWVAHSSEPQDHDGHGTHIVSLAMKIAPFADIFVARVASGVDTLEKSSQNVAEAISWATEDCSADIVSMAFGYPEEVPVGGERFISKSILQAVIRRDHQILFFAAGGNSGGNQKEMFPARHEFAIPIRSTDHEGVFQGFNPPPNYRGLDVFGTLGKDVPSAWLREHEGEKIQTGTSVATSIAAGIAAMLLADAQIMLGKCPSTRNKELVRRLWTRAGMRSMFENLSKETTWKCWYLYPMEYMRRSSEERHDLIRYAARQA